MAGAKTVITPAVHGRRDRKCHQSTHQAPAHLAALSARLAIKLLDAAAVEQALRVCRRGRGGVQSFRGVSSSGWLAQFLLACISLRSAKAEHVTARAATMIAKSTVLDDMAAAAVLFRGQERVAEGVYRWSCVKGVQFYTLSAGHAQNSEIAVIARPTIMSHSCRQLPQPARGGKCCAGVPSHPSILAAWLHTLLQREEQPGPGQGRPGRVTTHAKHRNLAPSCSTHNNNRFA